MAFDIAIWTLLHILVFVYWLGGDLGAFYTSRFLTEPGVSVEKRFMAAKVVNDVDMAPRTALILALPTGYMLAVTSGWLPFSVWTAWTLLVASLLWLALAWKLHMAHAAAPKVLAQLDLFLRWTLCAALTVLAILVFAGQLNIPQFIAIKFLLLAGAVLMGLFIRKVLKPLGPALAGLSGSNAPQAEADLAAVLKKAKPLVMTIWLLIILAAFTGLLKPQLF